MADRFRTEMVALAHFQNGQWQAANGHRSTDPVCKCRIRPDNIVPTVTTPENVLATIDSLPHPMTVDQVTDRLLDVEDPDTSDLQKWGDVHEYLFYRALPSLDRNNLVHFERHSGMVYPQGHLDDLTSR